LNACDYPNRVCQASSIKHQASSIENQASSIKPEASSIEHQEPSNESSSHQAATIITKHQASCIQPKD
jgi:hypothetical protein